MIILSSDKKLGGWGSYREEEVDEKKIQLNVEIIFKITYQMAALRIWKIFCSFYNCTGFQLIKYLLSFKITYLFRPVFTTRHRGVRCKHEAYFSNRVCGFETSPQNFYKHLKKLFSSVWSTLHLNIFILKQIYQFKYFWVFFFATARSIERSFSLVTPIIIFSPLRSSKISNILVNKFLAEARGFFRDREKGGKWEFKTK